MALAWNTYGTNDVLMWERYAAKAESDGGVALYRDGISLAPVRLRTEGYMQPPFMIHFARCVKMASDAAGVPFGFGFRFVAAIADLGTLALLSSFGVAAARLMVVALSPVAILVSGFHGNSDPVFVFLIVLAVRIGATYGAGIAAAIAFGMAVNSKLIAVFFMPLAVLHASGTRRRFVFLAITGLTIVGASAPYVWQDPRLILQTMLGYSSQFGAWGIPRIAMLLEEWFPPLRFFTLSYFVLGRYVLFAAILVYCWKFRRPQIPLFDRAAGIIPVFLTFTFGFSVQYLAWLIPWTGAFGLRQSIAFHVAATAFLVGVYTFWSGGMPWYFASAITKGLWPPILIPLELTTWAIIVWMLRSHIHRLKSLQAVS